MMWKIWPYLPDYGRRAAQFVDLLGYFAIKCESNTEEVHFIEIVFGEIACLCTSCCTMNPPQCTCVFQILKSVTTYHFTWGRVISKGSNVR